MLAVLLDLFVASQGGAQAPPARRADTRAWYQAYSDGTRAIQQGNWQAAIDSLEAAKRAGAPKPGRKIPFYGDKYDDFIPDYYLGVAYFNLKQYAQAERAFATVTASGLIGPRDREYAQFQTQAKAATAGAQAQTLAQNTAPPTGAAGTAVANAQPTTVPAPVNPQSPPPLNAAAAPGVQQPTLQTTTAPNSGAQSALPGPTNPGTAARNASAPVIPARVPTPTRTIPPAALGPSAVTNERDGIGAFLSGQYAQASNLLASAAGATGTTPRAYFYLACSRTALAIVGQADAAAITDARAMLARAGDPAQFVADRRYISPRILRMLGVNP